METTLELSNDGVWFAWSPWLCWTTLTSRWWPAARWSLWGLACCWTSWRNGHDLFWPHQLRGEFLAALPHSLMAHPVYEAHNLQLFKLRSPIYFEEQRTWVVDEGV